MRVIEIEATNLCNARCLMCPREALSRPKGRMTWPTFQAVADRALAFGQTRSFSFSGFGEPLLNRDLVSFIAYVSPHVETMLTTNGFLLDEPTIAGLLEAGLHHLVISFDGADAETYERIMVGLDFERTQAAVRRLVALDNPRLELTANVTVSKLTRDLLPVIKAHLNQLGIEDITYSLCHSRGGWLRDRTICSTPPPPPTERCDIFARTTFVAWDGSVLACCQDLGGEGFMGNLSQMSMQELADQRARVMEEGVSFPMCAECNDFYRLSDDQPPPGATLNEWIYRLYESEDSRQAGLTQALRSTEHELASVRAERDALQEETIHLRRLVSDYENGRFMRLMRWFQAQRKRLSKQSRGHG